MLSPTLPWIPEEVLAPPRVRSQIAHPSLCSIARPSAPHSFVGLRPLLPLRTQNIFLYRFLAGTALKLLAAQAGAIAYAEFYSVRVRYAKVAIHLHAADDVGSSFVNSNRWFGGVISGSITDVAILIEGPGANNQNVFFGITVEPSQTG